MKLRLLSLFVLPLNIEDNVQFRFGGTFAQHHDVWFRNCVPNFSIFCDIAIVEHALLVEIDLYMI